jgi:uncharacterized protein YlzI (FlbEa/FlbD family)
MKLIRVVSDTVLTSIVVDKIIKLEKINKNPTDKFKTTIYLSDGTEVVTEEDITVVENKIINS